MVFAASSYDGRQISLTPGVSIGAMNMVAKVGIGDIRRHVLAKKIVMRQRRASRHHLRTRDEDARIILLVDGDVDVLHIICSFLCRSMGGLTMAWFMNSTLSWARLYQARALSAHGP